MSSDSSQAHSLASSPRSSGSHNETIVRPSRSSTTTTISFPFSSIAHRWAEFRSTLATFSGVGNIDGRGGTNSARFTLRVEVEPDGGGSQHEESIRRRGDLASGRTDSRPLTPLRQSSGEAEPALAGPLDREEETTAAAAERYRLTSGTPGIDLQAITNWIEKSAPFLLLLLLIFIWKHGEGIFLFTAMGLLLYHANDTMRKLVSLKEERRGARQQLAILAISTIGHCQLWVMWTHKYQLWRNLLPVPVGQKVNSVWDTIFRVTTVDFLVRFYGILVKVAVVAWHPVFPEAAFRRRAQILTAIEHALLFYRSVLPMPVWIAYFYNGQLWLWVANGIAGLYFLMKVVVIAERASTVWTAVKAVLKREAAFGQYATEEEIMEGGNTCAICQDPMTTPVKLHCKHMFCNSCITEWLIREPTCPMCRAEIRPANLVSFGDGATSLLPQLF